MERRLGFERDVDGTVDHRFNEDSREWGLLGCSGPGKEYETFWRLSDVKDCLLQCKPAALTAAERLTSLLRDLLLPSGVCALATEACLGDVWLKHTVLSLTDLIPRSVRKISTNQIFPSRQLFESHRENSDLEARHGVFWYIYGLDVYVRIEASKGEPRRLNGEGQVGK